MTDRTDVKSAWVYMGALNVTSLLLDQSERCIQHRGPHVLIDKIVDQQCSSEIDLHSLGIIQVPQ